MKKNVKAIVKLPVSFEIEMPECTAETKAQEVEFKKTDRLIEIDWLQKKRPRVDIWIKVEGVDSLQNMPVSLYNNKIVVDNTAGVEGTIVIS